MKERIAHITLLFLFSGVLGIVGYSAAYLMRHNRI